MKENKSWKKGKNNKEKQNEMDVILSAASVNKKCYGSIVKSKRQLNWFIDAMGKKNLINIKKREKKKKKTIEDRNSCDK